MSVLDLPVPRNLERFPELHPALDSQSALAEANRCLFCFDAPCMGACPTHIDVPRFIKKISSGNLRGSALTILDANILGPDRKNPARVRNASTSGLTLSI